MAITLIPSILSWKKITAKTGTTGKLKTLMTLEKSEDTSRMSPTAPILQSCHEIAVHVKVMTYENFPSRKPVISFLKTFQSPLVNSPTRAQNVATID
ncbi:hypothetical protein L484_000382 [Morus notabilis]|uniref:Uncharacterized protein n=1 Tax=Morus notabilis TaxID=981085 RepID=W9SMF6_9ROSA|nr:hypothetical protein L484_000382 [Morus notabilis]